MDRLKRSFFYLRNRFERKPVSTFLLIPTMYLGGFLIIVGAFQIWPNHGVIVANTGAIFLLSLAGWSGYSISSGYKRLKQNKKDR
ncbi:hypothetical protein [Cochlodiniinecator piscidefendens]|uniref:hypothetical protein n=1 Tax=Cochlodiniinecator piscidefendens TaxID=2715756 RepID=UPI00140B8D30|nr:hypothetical protein [Cochlodiniinecator piscidefendens]